MRARHFDNAGQMLMKFATARCLLCGRRYRPRGREKRHVAGYGPVCARKSGQVA